MSDHKLVFKKSYRRLLGREVSISNEGSSFFHRFYENFIAASPEARKKFANTNISEQVKMLQRSMFHMINFYETGSEYVSLLKIADSHSKREHDIEPSLYDIWMEAFVKTVGEMDPEYDDSVELAWRLALTPGITLMKHYHHRPVNPSGG